MEGSSGSGSGGSRLGGAYLPTDDSDGGERLPERALAAGAAAVVTEDGARALDPVHQPDQAPHGRHPGRGRTRWSATRLCVRLRRFVGGGEQREAVGSNEWEERRESLRQILKKRACSFACEVVVVTVGTREDGFAWTRRSSTGAGELSPCRWGYENCGVMMAVEEFVRRIAGRPAGMDV